MMRGRKKGRREAAAHLLLQTAKQTSPYVFPTQEISASG